MDLLKYFNFSHNWYIFLNELTSNYGKRIVLIFFYILKHILKLEKCQSHHFLIHSQLLFYFSLLEMQWIAGAFLVSCISKYTF